MTYPAGNASAIHSCSFHSCSVFYRVKVEDAQSSPTLCNPMDCIVHGILQARILEWVAFPFSRGSSQPRDQTQVSRIAGRFFTSCATRGAQEDCGGWCIPFPADLPDPGIELGSSALQVDSLPIQLSGKPILLGKVCIICFTTCQEAFNKRLPVCCFGSVRNPLQFSSVAQSHLTLCDPMNRSTPGLPVHHQLPEFTQTHAHGVGDAIQPSRPLSSPSPPAPNPSKHQGLFQ